MSEWETEEEILRSMGNGQYEDYRIVSADEAERRVLDLKAQLATEQKRVKRLLEALAIIHEITGQPSVAHECISALADTQEMTLDDHTRMAFGQEE